MGDFNPFQIDEFTWDVLKCYMKHGYNMFKLYNTTFFNCQMTDETVCMTLEEFSEKVVNYDGELWSKISPIEY